MEDGSSPVQADRSSANRCGAGALARVVLAIKVKSRGRERPRHTIRRILPGLTNPP